MPDKKKRSPGSGNPSHKPKRAPVSATVAKAKNSARPGSPKPDRLAIDIGRRIVLARDGLGWSQQALSAQSKMVDQEGVGVARATLSLYETGINKPGARETVILCAALKITPNWLLCGSETPAKNVQASLDFLNGSDLNVSIRLAFAMVALDPSERELLAGLAFSLLTRKLGDIGLSSLVAVGSMISDDMRQAILKFVGEDSKDLPLRELLDRFTSGASNAMYTNWGTLRPAVPEDELSEFDPDSPPPPRKL